MGFDTSNEWIWSTNVADRGAIIERVAVTAARNLLHTLVILHMDDEAALLEAAAAAVLAGLITSLRTTSTNTRFGHDESRRAANACRAFIVFVVLFLKSPNRNLEKHNRRLRQVQGETERNLGHEVPDSHIRGLMEVASAAAARLPNERAAVLHGIIAAMKQHSGTSKQRPLLGWCRQGEEHSVFSPNIASS